MRLGILGGTFDPIHCGHLRMARYCLDKLKLDKIYFIPAGNPPHKKPRVPYEQRVHMLDLALRNYPDFEINELEKHEQARNYTYTYYTLEKLKYEHPDYTLFFLMGEDNVAEITTWFKYRELLDLAHFVIISRPSDNRKQHNDLSFNKELSYLEMPKIDISSKDIRKMCSSGMSIQGLVPGSVENFIKTKKLYL